MGSNTPGEEETIFDFWVIRFAAKTKYNGKQHIADHIGQRKLYIIPKPRFSQNGGIVFHAHRISAGVLKAEENACEHRHNHKANQA